MPNDIEVVYCPRCYSLKIRGRWIPVSSYEDFMERVSTLITSNIKCRDGNVKILSVKTKLEFEEPKAVVTLTISLAQKAVSVLDYVVRIKWRRSLCPTCFRRAGGTFSAVIQVRFFNYDIRLVNKIKDLVLSREFANDIIEIEDNKWGFDIKVNSPFVAKRIVDVLRRSIKIPSRVVESVGDIRRRRDGKRYGKLYLSLRFINVKQGDYVVYRGRAYTVSVVGEKEVILRDSDGRKVKVKISEFVGGLKR